MNVAISSKFLGLKLRERTVAAVTGARVQESSTRATRRPGESHVGPPTTRVVLSSPSGDVPIRSAYTSESAQHRELAQKLDRTIRDSGSSRFSENTGVGWVGLVMVGFGVAFAAVVSFGRGGTLLVDGKQNLVEFSAPGIPRPQTCTYRLDEIVEFCLSKSVVAFRLTSGEIIPIGTGWIKRRPSGRHTVAPPSQRTKDLVQKLEKLRVTWREQTAAVSTSRRSEPIPLVNTLPSDHGILDSKPCGICHQDCSNEPRFQDESGHYYHQRCVPDASR